MSTFYRAFGKRALDIGVSASGLLILSPVLAATAVAVRLKLGKPVIFRHSRPGKGTKHFELYKFRTMTDARDSNGDLLSDKDRITKFGAALRTSSLDELPELINVLKGDLSLVGPRPLLTRYLPYYTHLERSRFDIRPGLTGWAQVHGRNSVNWNERLSYDAWYAKNVSFLLDLRIVLKTVKIVFRRQGIEIVPNTVMKSLDVERAEHG